MPNSSPSRRTNDRPSPRPPTRRVADPSTCSNALNTPSSRSSEMPGPRVADPDPHRGAVGSSAATRVMAAPDRAVLHRVVEELVERLGHPAGVDEHVGQRRRRAAAEVVRRAAGPGRARPPAGRRRSPPPRRVCGAAVDPAGLERGHVDEQVHRAAHRVGRLEDRADVARHLLRRQVRAAAQDLGVAADRRQRGAQLVADVGEELGLHPLDLALPGDVAQHDHPATGPVAAARWRPRPARAAVRPGAARRCRRRCRPGPSPAAAAGSPSGSTSARTSSSGAPQHVGLVDAEQRQRRGVDAGHGAGGVGGEQPVGHRAEHRLEPAAQGRLLLGGVAELVGGAPQRVGHAAEHPREGADLVLADGLAPRCSGRRGPPAPRRR